MTEEAQLSAFHAILTQMMSADNTIRQNAEKEFEAIALQQRSALLFQIYAALSVAEECRSLALVLLRRLLSSSWDELMPLWGEEIRKQFTAQLLQVAQTETNENLRRKITDLIAEVARNMIDDDTGAQKWGEVVQFIQHCSHSDAVPLKEMALSIIEDVPNIFGMNSKECLPGVKSLFEACLTHEQSKVRSAAVKAYVSYIVDNDEDEATVKSLGKLAPYVIKVCEHVVMAEDDDDTPLQCLSDLATSLPKTLQAHLQETLTMCINIIRDSTKEECYRHSALEVITSLCESAPNMVKKRASFFLSDILSCCLLLMTELSDEIEEWLHVDDVEEEEEEESVTAGESSLDRIACALNGKTLVPIVLSLAHAMLVDADWKKRHAGLMGLSTIGEGCQRSMEPHIVNIVKTVVPFLNDPHPRVRYAACNALGQMSTDFAPTLQKKCHAEVMPALIHTVADVKTPRVSAHAGAAMVNFSEECPKAVISAYLPSLMTTLEQVLEATFKYMAEHGKKLILEQIITTIASIADASQELFVRYYDKLVPPLKYILENTSPADVKAKVLRGKTIECLSLIGLAVGVEKFGEDAAHIMRTIGPTMETMEPDDPQCSYFISSWTRICKVLGPNFAEYLPMVMPAIMRAASYNPDVTVVDDEEVTEDPAWTFHSVGEKKQFGIRTSGIEEKATACDMIVCYARELKEAFAPYVAEVSELMVSHLKFFFHEGVRASAAETLPHLLACVKSQGIHAQRRLWEAFWPALKDALNTEVEVEVCSEYINAVAECIQELGAQGLTAVELQQIGEMLSEQLVEYEKRRKGREEVEHDEDADPDEAKEGLDDEEETESAVLSRLSDVIHAGFKAIGPEFFQLVEPMLGAWFALIDQTRPYSDRQWGLCVVDDLIEFAPVYALKYRAEICAALGQSLRDEFPEVRQAAAYGFGAMALNGVAEWAPHAASALQPLAEMISRVDARMTEEGTVATENAISAVAKIVRRCTGGMDVNNILTAFISWLPIQEDHEESVHVYEFLAELVEGNHPAILGANNENLPRILAIIVKAFHSNAFGEIEERLAASQEVQLRLKNIIGYMHQNKEMFQAVVAAADLDDGEKVTLQNILISSA